LEKLNLKEYFILSCCDHVVRLEKGCVAENCSLENIMPYIHMSYKAEYDLKRLTSENYRYQGNAAKGGQLL
jgi:hypothetical protein